MSFDISDSDFDRGKKYMESLLVPVPNGKKAEQKQFVADWIRLNGMTDQEINDHLASIEKGATPVVANKPQVEVSPIKTATRPTGNNVSQWRAYVADLAANGVIEKYTGGNTVADMKGYIDGELAKKANLKPDTFTEDELKDLS